MPRSIEKEINLLIMSEIKKGAINAPFLLKGI
jgi:hypothetical protein